MTSRVEACKELLVLRRISLHSGKNSRDYLDHQPRITAVTLQALQVRIASSQMDRRRHPRITSALPVRIWGVDANCRPFMQLARVTNLSDNGAQVDGLRHRLKAGEVVDLQYNNVKAEFMVVWAGQHGTRSQGELGLQLLPSQPCIWDSFLEHACEFSGKG